MRDWKEQWTAENYDRFHWNLPNISIAVDVFGKAYYSLLLSDFNSTDEIKSTNALSTGDGLAFLQDTNDTDLAEARVRFDGQGDGMIDKIYNTTTTNLTEPLDAAQYTTIFSRYLCSIPRPKSTFKLLFAVVLADIVFLSACWTAFGLIATWCLRRRSSDTEHCIGCFNGVNEIPLALVPSSGGGGGSYSRVSSDVEDEQRANVSRLSMPQIARVHSSV